MFSGSQHTSRDTSQKTQPAAKSPLNAQSSLPAVQNNGIVQKAIPAMQNANVNTLPAVNTTGMPSDLKDGIENLSGTDMSDVNVHYNSDKPFQLNALAYAQGTDIHIGPGQEQHLPHEAWHIVQQKQGRVQPTIQMKTGIAVNDDPGLEKEADIMGAKALQMKRPEFSSGIPAKEMHLPGPGSTNIIQRKIEASSFKELLPEQKKLSEKLAALGLAKPDPEAVPMQLPAINIENENGLLGAAIQQNLPVTNKTQLQYYLSTYINENARQLADQVFIESSWPEFFVWLEKTAVKKHTTVGFEFEFAAMTGANPFEGASHVEISESTEEINGLPFILETDASNTLELVTPPLWIETINAKNPIPLQSEVNKVDQMAKSRLKILTGDLTELEQENTDEVEQPAEKTNDITLKTMAEQFAIDPGLHFALSDLQVHAKNLSKKLQKDYHKGNNTVPKADVEGITIEPVKKRGKIDTQINIATDPATFLAIEDLVKRLNKRFEDDLRYHHLYDYLNANALTLIPKQEDNPSQQRIEAFAKIVIRYLAGLPAIPYSVWLSDQLDILFTAASGERTRRKALIGGRRQENQQQGAKFNDWTPNETPDAFSSFYETAASTSSHVKDIHSVWLKDTVMNVGLGMLQTKDWTIVKEWIELVDKRGVMQNYDAPKEFYESKMEGSLAAELDMDKPTPLPKDKLEKVKNLYNFLRANLQQAVKQILADIKVFKLEESGGENNFLGPLHQQEFLKHTARWIGPRQDTYVDAPKVSLPAMWPNLRLHVVELRMDNIGEILRQLEENPPQVLGGADQALPPMRYMASTDWMATTGFKHPDTINYFWNEYATTIKDPLAGQYNVRGLKFEATAIKKFAEWLKEEKLSAVEIVKELRLENLDDLEKQTNLYRKFSPAKAKSELDFYTNHLANFKIALQVSRDMKSSGYFSYLPIEQIWGKMGEYMSAIGTPVQLLDAQQIKVWDEQVQALKKASAKNYWDNK